MFGLVIIGQQVGQFFGEGADVVPVLGRDRQQGEAQAVELGQQLVFLFQAVHLVDHAKGGQAHAADVGRQIFVQGQQAVTAVHHEGHGTGVLHGRLGLAQDVGLEAADAFGAFGDHGMGIQGDAAGIHDAEIRMALAADHTFHAVAGHAGTVMGDGAVAADQAVEQSGLAHVGASHQNDAG